MHRAEYIRAKETNLTSFAAIRHTPPTFEERSSFSLFDSNGASRLYPATEENLLRVLGAYGHHLSSSRDLARLNDDEYQAELDVIAHVSAYFDISSKRVIDDIPQIFEAVFARNFGERLAKELTTNLNLIGERGLDNCAKFVRDEPDVEGKRIYLTRLRGILEKARETIDRFFK